MIRLLFVPFFALLLCSCETNSDEVDPLFYQISEVDSIECMEEIIHQIRLEGKENQLLLYPMYESDIPFCGYVDVYRIVLNSQGDLMVDGVIDSLPIQEGIVNHFIFNRNLKNWSDEEFYQDENRYAFSFYDYFTEKEIKQSVRSMEESIKNERSQKLKNPREAEYDKFRLKLWKRKLAAVRLIKDKTIPVSFASHIRLSYQIYSKEVKRVLDEIAISYYHLRNHECMRHFSETYLSLFDRAKRKKYPRDLEKLEALEAIHPAIIIEANWSKKNRGDE